ncbi:MAG TPA: hypothetical protein VFB21_04990 [Chthonomonadaceae bacterium]|nr:hypothetical protein [Chthonomonadaceae bacterium]
MPKSHFPLRGGPHPPVWASGAGRLSERNAGAEPSAARILGQELLDRHALEAEVQRLRQELARVRKAQADRPSPGPAARGAATSGMIWVALALCGLGLAFALLAVLNHG